MNPIPSPSPELQTPNMPQGPLESGFEKHAQTAIQVILVGITLWVGSAIITLRDAAIRLEEKTAQTRESLTDVKAEIGALRIILSTNVEKNVILDQKLKELESRINNIERRRSKE